MSNLVFECPNCSSAFRVTPEMSGQVVACPTCHGSVTIPDQLASSTNPSDHSTTDSRDPIIKDCPSCRGQFGVTPEMERMGFACPHCQSVFPASPHSGSLDSTTGDDEPAEEDMFAPGFRPASPTTKTQPDNSTSGAQETSQPASQQHHPASPPSEKPADAGVVGVPSFRLPNQTEPSVKEAAKKDTSLEHLLPPRFLADDPDQPFQQSTSPTKVVLPDGSGGVQQVNSRIVTVEYRGLPVELVSRSPEDQIRYRRTVNALSILVGLIMIGIAIAILLW